jgi:hypothetical protein
MIATVTLNPALYVEYQALRDPGIARAEQADAGDALDQHEQQVQAHAEGCRLRPVSPAAASTPG